MSEPVTHCPRGHPYDAVNTKHTRQTGGGPMRRCRTCVRREKQEYRVRHRSRINAEARAKYAATHARESRAA